MFSRFVFLIFCHTCSIFWWKTSKKWNHNTVKIDSVSDCLGKQNAFWVRCGKLERTSPDILLPKAELKANASINLKTHLETLLESSWPFGQSVMAWIGSCRKAPRKKLPYTWTVDSALQEVLQLENSPEFLINWIICFFHFLLSIKLIFHPNTLN